VAANKKKRKRPPATATAAPAISASSAARRERKSEARAARAKAEAQRSRRRTARRAVTFVALGALAVGAVWWVNRVAGARSLSPEVIATAQAAGCAELREPSAETTGGQHLAEGQDPGYTESPATSGLHDPTWLPEDPRVKTGPVDETQAVHTLEHGSVIAYYRAPGEGGVSPEVLDRLAAVANTESNPATYTIPYPDLPEGSGLAITAWNKVMTCPAGITADQAGTIVQGFVDAYACTSNAPEGGAGAGC